MPIDSRERWEVVHDRLRSQILSGDLQPGERILEVETALAFGTSRGPVREAMRALEVEGLVVREGRRGSFVAALDPEDVRELYSFRLALESFAIPRAIDRNQRRLHVTLQAELEAMRSDLDSQDRVDFLERDLAFHGAFYEFADHRRLLNAWQGLTDPLRLVLGLTSARPQSDHMITIEGHEAIVDAVSHGDAVACAEATRAHLGRAVDLVCAYIRDREEAAGQAREMVSIGSGP